jgi:hypothetical protein
MSEVSMVQLASAERENELPAPMTTRVLNGPLRVHVGANAAPEQEGNAETPSSVRVLNGAMRYVAGGEAQQIRHARVSVQEGERAGVTGLLATARTPWGSIAGTLTPDTLVDTGGGVMASLAVAERLGLVRRDANGNYTEATQGATEAQPEEESEDAPEVVQQEAFKPEDEAALVKLAEGVAPEVLGGLAIPAALSIAETGALNITAEDVQSRTGLDAERATEFLEKTTQLFQDQADDVARKAQVDPEALWRWAREHRPDQLRNAVAGHVSARTLSGYRALAQDYLRSVVPDANTLQDAGYEVRRDPSTGETLVKLNGTWISATVAARQGRI